MTFEAKYLGSNGWLIKFDKTNLIIDPWLTGDLVFPPGEWFFKGSLDNEIIIDEDINIILLTQGLPDHCHVPSLKKFKKDIDTVSYTHLRAHETRHDLVCRLLLDFFCWFKNFDRSKA